MTPLNSVSENILAHSLEPYAAKNCRYLNTMSATYSPERWVGQGHFSITTSSYIRDTGHFNAAEFIICFNQMFYALVAQGISEAAIPQLAHWDLEEFTQRQLPAIVIRNNRSSFTDQLDSTSFYGFIEARDITLVNTRREYLSVSVDISFAESVDATKKPATGHVDIAILLDDLVSKGNAQ